MKLGILADIHEEVGQLRRAIDLLSRHGADRFVVLGDVFETGKRIEETVGRHAGGAPAVGRRQPPVAATRSALSCRCRRGA